MYNRQQWTRQGRVSSMIALGICIDEAATTEAALHHRLGQALRHWFDKSAQLTRRGVPLRLRLRRFEETVLATLLWGAGGWTLNSSLVQTLTSFQLNCVKRMLNRRRRPDENYVLDQARFKHGPHLCRTAWWFLSGGQGLTVRSLLGGSCGKVRSDYTNLVGDPVVMYGRSQNTRGPATQTSRRPSDTALGTSPGQIPWSPLASHDR